MTKKRYGIAEWYGQPFTGLLAEHRERLASIALEENHETPLCPYQKGRPPCQKRGGVCSLQRYARRTKNRIGSPQGSPVIVCPARFEEGQLLIRWLADIVGFPAQDAMLAREVPFMLGTQTDKSAGKIDVVVARTANDRYGLEIQAVYFSGKGMNSEFEDLRNHVGPTPPFPNAVRRPDWRSSSAKRLMPQLQIKVPTLRRWGSKMAVAVDQPFFDSIGGPSKTPSQNLGDGDIIWMVPNLSHNETGRHQLVRGHWEVLTLEESSAKLLAAQTVQPEVFETVLRSKLESLD